MRGTTTNVMGRWLKIEGNTVDCSLPYIGREDIPHMKTRAEMRMDSKLEFKSEIQNYLLKLEAKKKRGVITFSTKYSGDEYQFNITVDNTGSARIRVTPEDRDYIEYEGDVYGL